VSGDRFEHAAVLFADVVGFTTHSSSMDPTDVVALLEHMFSAFDAICDQHGVTKVKTIGDAYMCFKGDVGGSDNAWALAQVALAMQRTPLFWPSNVAHEVAHEVAHNVAHNVAHEVAHNVDHNVAHKVLLRIGLHLGPATAGVIGTQRLQYDVWGDTVNVASRLESSCEPGRIHVSEAFANDLREAFVIPNPEGVSDLHLELRGEVELKGKGLVKTFWLTSATDHP
jgi:class 3 adenylate cyclase